ncbi:hypothetical protein HOP62_07440 [Halomonas sp. MCCC 1A17488]|uniref:putative holin n=1 Tax=Halomonadaceae TaxID=28256 RepID=UPI000CDF20F1|nr:MULTISPECIES: putative holin [Halomonas]MCE8015906.1 hypothetical protein [Halomonas sp. MCCC 1A17488]MCE8028816.1 hypothetical protein [Halomonas desiderata]MCG3239239.1 hypothetical protein [Halomonas sp. MCCC 1A17488]QPP50826.1 hypothetical protein I4484_06945 [Halomonas sp. SS10-MC5]
MTRHPRQNAEDLMAEPSTATFTGIVTLGATLFGLIPGVDANAIVGALCGAALFVVSAKGLTLLERLIYLVISFLIGYLGGPSQLSHLFEHTAVSAFIAAAISVTAGLRIIDAVKHFDLKAWLGPGGKQ